MRTYDLFNCSQPSISAKYQIRGTQEFTTGSSYSRLLTVLSRQLLSISEGGDSTPFEQPVPVFNHLHSGKSVFLCFSLYPLPFVLLLSTTKKSLAPLILLSPPYTTIHMDKISPRLFCSRLSSPSPNHLYSLSLDLLHYVHVSFVLNYTELDPALYMCLTRTG